MWREIVELSRPKNVILAAITVPLGAHLALGGAWDLQALGLVALQTTSAICFIAAGNTFNDIADVSIDIKSKPNKPITSITELVSNLQPKSLTHSLYLVQHSWPLALIWHQILIQ